ncbi:unnamed protein product [Sphenostylis stenocarpa]|uniref:Heme-binding protein 2 n=1 Tax=Sphenostylis stenocarpa TaxID=92480 RepID=A0AA86S933_9FABA|nr:unnamed protein product [Sphenostylis stenocarpa]
MSASTTIQFLSVSFLLLVSFWGVEGKIPPSCKKFECPSYDVTKEGNDYEIRRYNSPVFISNSPVSNISLVKATRVGVLRLFSYIHGNNTGKKVIKMTAPVISEVSNSGGNSSIVVSFYVPKDNQKDPPLANGLHVQRWKPSYVAVRQFGGFVTDTNVWKEVAALNASIAATKWSAATHKSFFVAQYNSPFELFNRVNEIWFLYQ